MAREVKQANQWRTYKLLCEPVIEGQFTIDNLTQETCKWITKDEPYNQHYCGAKTVRQYSWCDAHLKVVYAKYHVQSTGANEQQQGLGLRTRKGFQDRRIQELDKDKWRLVAGAEAEGRVENNIVPIQPRLTGGQEPIRSD